MQQQTAVDLIPLGRRVAEIMEEKGAAYTIRSFSQRIGMSKDKLCRCINGERYIKPSELENIAEGLHLSVERIRQDDIKKEAEELQKLLKNLANLQRALQLAESLTALALGRSEKSIALNNLGRVLFLMRDYDQAHAIWLEAYADAKRLSGLWGESEVLYDVLTNLLISFSARKEYIQLQQILAEIKPILYSSANRAGAISYSVAMIAYKNGQFEEAREKLYESLDCYLKLDDVKSVGMAERNVAFIEYRMRNYETAIKWFESAIPKLSVDPYWQAVAVKDFVKAMKGKPRNPGSNNIFQ